MSYRACAAVALLISGGVGTGVGLLAAGPGPGGKPDPQGAITGVRSAADGSAQGDARQEATPKAPQNTVQPVTDEHGSVQSIRGIQGIDQVQLQNLEAVLRIQSRVSETKPQGSVRAAAKLMTMEQAQPEDPQEVSDSRQEHQQTELEGS